MGDAPGLDHHRGGEHPDHRIAALATAQHGVVSRPQLLTAGLSARAIERRVEHGRLHLRYRGVYAVGHAHLTERGRWMAAVLAAGGAAVLSHRSAARLWGLRVSERKIEVTAPKDRRRAGLKIHVAALPADEVTTTDGIPTTTAARTLLDLAAVATPLTLERALHEAERLQLADATPLAPLLHRYPRRPGTPALRAILATHGLGDDVTDSALEDAFLAFLDHHGLPRPQLNRWLKIGPDWIRADALYPDRRLIIELDGRRTHHTTAAFERDRSRDRRLKVLGWEVIRVTWRELHVNRDELAGDLRALLTTSSQQTQPHP